MGDRPPPLPRRLSRVWIVVLVGVPLLLVGAVVMAVVLVARSGVTRPIDDVFGDQHLKTVVALVELHRVRYGEYPRTLSDLRFTGQWDAIHTQSVSYCAAEDRRSYYVEVARGWAFKPALTVPPEFWRGTGFNRALGPCP
jgi:hypothetical protein